MTLHIKPPQMPTNLSLVETRTPLSDEDIYSDCCMDRCVFTGKVRSLNIARARLRNVRFETSLPAAEFEDVVFDRCDLSNVDFRDAILWRIVFQNCKMTGVNFI